MTPKAHVLAGDIYLLPSARTRAESSKLTFRRRESADLPLHLGGESQSQKSRMETSWLNFSVKKLEFELDVLSKRSWRFRRLLGFRVLP